MLAAIADARPGGVVFHCGGGRDRAGQIAMLILAIAGVAPEVIASDYALSFERLPAPVIRRYLAERGTTAERVIVDLLTTVDVPETLRAAGLSDAHMERLRARLLDQAMLPAR